jgi:predicted deacylase
VSSKRKQIIPVTTLASGFQLSLTTLTVTGASPGPTVGISAMIHGDELEGLLILRELWSTLDVEELSGTLVLLPVANPLALDTISRNTPVDMLDLNRNVPGSRAGWLSEQLAWVLSEEFLNRIDHYIDIHAGGVFPWVDYCYVVNDEALSRAFLSELLYQPERMFQGTTAAFTAARGVPTTVIEIGGGYHDQQQHIRNGIRGLMNMLRQIGVLGGGVESRPGQVLLRKMEVMRPTRGGICVPAQALRPGTRLHGATKLADIVSPYTFDTLETITTPFDESIVVLSRNYMTRIQPGDYMFMMGDGATATPYDD